MVDNEDVNSTLKTSTIYLYILHLQQPTTLSEERNQVSNPQHYYQLHYKVIIKILPVTKYQMCRIVL